MSHASRPNLILCAPRDAPVEPLRQRLAAHPGVAWVSPDDGARLDAAAARFLTRGRSFDLPAADRDAGPAEPAGEPAPRYLGWQPRRFLEFPVVQWHVVRQLPAVRLIFFLADPIDLAYRRYLAQPGDMPDSFERAIAECEAMMAKLGRWSSRNRWDRYFAKPSPLSLLLQGGVYEPPLARCRRLLDAAQIHRLTDEDLRSDPRRALDEIWRFLDLPAVEPAAGGAADDGGRPPEAPIPAAARARLEKIYAEHNGRLARLLGGLPASWASAGREG